MLKLDASTWPPVAFCSTRNCSGATVANPTMPNNALNAIIAGLLCSANVIAPSTIASATSEPSSVITRCLSASLPPSRLPTTMPPPNTSRIGDTALSAKPVTRVRMGWM